jgi:hypothetical protein
MIIPRTLQASCLSKIVNLLLHAYRKRGLEGNTIKNITESRNNGVAGGYTGDIAGASRPADFVKSYVTISCLFRLWKSTKQVISSENFGSYPPGATTCNGYFGVLPFCFYI